MGWLQGVAFNALLAAGYLLLWPLTTSEQYDIVSLFTVYFATFIMADVTTTNVFGHDILRTVRALEAGRSFASLIAVKNLVQVMVVVIPMSLITFGVTCWVEGADDLALTVPRVLYPMLLWLGIGNLLSVLAPALPAPLAWRIGTLRRGWPGWRLHRATLLAYAMPYLLYYLTAASDLPGNLNALFSLLGSMPQKWQSGYMLLTASAVIYLVVTWLSVRWHDRRGLVLWMQRDFVEEAPLPGQVRAAARRLVPPAPASEDAADGCREP